MADTMIQAKEMDVSITNRNYIPVGVNSTNEGVKANSTVRVKSTGKM